MSCLLPVFTTAPVFNTSLLSDAVSHSSLAMSDKLFPSPAIVAAATTCLFTAGFLVDVPW
jgi:hypothetical protein